MDSKTSIVILNWNGSNMLKKFLPSVLACSANAEVVVADNASTDGSLDLLRRAVRRCVVCPHHPGIG